MNEQLRAEMQRLAVRCSDAAKDHGLTVKTDYSAGPAGWPETMALQFAGSAGDLTLLFSSQMADGQLQWRCVLGSLQGHRQELAPWKHALLRDLAARFPRHPQVAADIQLAAKTFAPVAYQASA